jgi:hypothetical protein
LHRSARPCQALFRRSARISLSSRHHLSFFLLFYHTFSPDSINRLYYLKNNAFPAWRKALFVIIPAADLGIIQPIVEKINLKAKSHGQNIEYSNPLK